MEIADAFFSGRQVNIHRQLIEARTRGHDLVFSLAQTREAVLTLRIRLSRFEFGHRVEQGDASSGYDLPGRIESCAGNRRVLRIVRGTAGGSSRSLCVGAAGQKQNQGSEIQYGGAQSHFSPSPSRAGVEGCPNDARASSDACVSGLRLRRSPGLAACRDDLSDNENEIPAAARPSHPSLGTAACCDSLLQTVARAEKVRLTVARRRRFFTVFPCAESLVIVYGAVKIPGAPLL